MTLKNKLINIFTFIVVVLVLITGIKIYNERHCTIKGKFLVVTKGGDVKPAIMSDVYIIRNFRGSEIEPDKVLSLFKNSENMDDKINKLITATSDLVLIKELIQFDKSNPNCSYECKTNLEGYFEMKGIPSGEYEVFCFGHAGANNVIWFDVLNLNWTNPTKTVECVSTLSSHLDL